MKFVSRSNQQRISYYSSGNLHQQVPLVLLHGFCEDSSVWEPLLPMLEKCPLLRIDLPGFGSSDLATQPGMDQYAAAVLEVLDVLKLSKAVVVGHSMGGYTALELAAHHSGRLAGWGLVHSHPLADNDERIANRKRGIQMLQEGKKDLYVAQLFPGLFTPDFAARHPEVLEGLIQNGQRQSAKGIVAALEGMILRKDHTNTLQNSAVPVLLLLGALDQLVPHSLALEMLSGPAVAELSLLPEVAHMGMFEDAAATAASILRFYHFCTG